MEEQMANEIKIQYKLDHPNIIKLYGYFFDNEYLYLLQELAPQGELF